MSSRNRNVQVKMVRIQWSDKPQPVTHQNNVTVGIPKDLETNITYLRITVNQKIIITEELKKFQWLEQSCVDGVATINSSSMKIIIIYDAKDDELREFFTEMKNIVKQKTREESPVRPVQPTGSAQSAHSPSQEQAKVVIHDLVRYIENGPSSEVTSPIRYLAKSKTNVEFSLISRLDNDEQETVSIKKSKTGSLSNVLQLKLQIECHLDREPIVETIYVRSGMNLQSLKEQIQNETGIHCKDQYWYAFDQYLISNDYVFGSNEPVAPPLPRNAPRKQKPPPIEPIRSGDTLIMCIAQIPPFK